MKKIVKMSSAKTSIFITFVLFNMFISTSGRLLYKSTIGVSYTKEGNYILIPKYLVVLPRTYIKL